MPVNRQVFIVGSDRWEYFQRLLVVWVSEGDCSDYSRDSCRSEELVKIASKHEPHSTIIADTLHLPHPARFFDFAISIAVVHHLSTPERRIEAIRSILETLKLPTQPGEAGRVLIYAWALEQKNSRRGWDANDEQDVMVPWVTTTKAADGTVQSKTVHRYYHLYRSGELERDITAAGGLVIDQGYEKDNWWAIAETSTS